MIPIRDILLCALTVMGGLAAIHFAKPTGTKIALLIAAFWLSRIFAARAWINITGSILYLSTVPAFWFFLLATIFSMSILLIFPTQISIGQSWREIGWKRENWQRQLLGAIPAFLLIGMVILIGAFRNVDLNKLIASAIFSFAISSWQEEVIFRGQLMAYLKQKKMNTVAIILLQAAIFSLAHVGFAPADILPYYLPSAFLLGGIFGAIRWLTDGQMGGFLLHGVLNFISIG